MLNKQGGSFFLLQIRFFASFFCFLFWFSHSPPSSYFHSLNPSPCSPHFLSPLLLLSALFHRTRALPFSSFSSHSLVFPAKNSSSLHSFFDSFPFFSAVFPVKTRTDSSSFFLQSPSSRFWFFQQKKDETETAQAPKFSVCLSSPLFSSFLFPLFSLFSACCCIFIGF